jgi:hypothetical protein
VLVVAAAVTKTLLLRPSAVVATRQKHSSGGCLVEILL